MQQNIEFERCIDFLVRMIDKYGEEVLRKLEEEKQNKEEKTAQNTSFHSICKTVEVSFSQVRLAILHRKQSLFLDLPEIISCPEQIAMIMQNRELQAKYL